MSKSVKILKILDAGLPQKKLPGLVKTRSITAERTAHLTIKPEVGKKLAPAKEIKTNTVAVPSTMKREISKPAGSTVERLSSKVPSVEATPIVTSATLLEINNPLKELPSLSEVVANVLPFYRLELVEPTVPVQNKFLEIEGSSESTHYEIDQVKESLATSRHDVLKVELAKPNPVEFFADVAPALTMVVAEFIAMAEPEVRAEVEARVEQLVIVADRLHELVVTGRSDNEEAQQIVAFLCREYEQLLLAVGVEPTDELLQSFIAYVRSDTYLTVEQKTGKALEIEDEGTHEKKLFKEQTVFMRAQSASAALSRRIGSKLGQLAMVSF